MNLKRLRKKDFDYFDILKKYSSGNDFEQLVVEQELELNFFRDYKVRSCDSKIIRIFILVEPKDNLSEILKKIAYFYGGMSGVFITLRTNENIPEFLEDDSDFDPSISEKFDFLKYKISTTKSLLAFDQFDILFSTSLTPKEDVQEYIENAKNIKKLVFYVDKEKQRHEGSMFIQAIYVFRDFYQNTIDSNIQKFKDFHRSNKRLKSFIFTSGPTIDSYKEFNYEHGLKLVCNTVTLDREFMNNIKPDILFFADPLFHYGPSIYASEFRDSVREAMNNFPKLIIISTNKFAYMLCYLFPEFKERVITIPVEPEGNINIHLNSEKSFFTRATDNIFTLLMLPVAATLTKEIYTIGVDGKPISLDNKFWKYGKKSQNNDKYSSLKRLHPGFFNLDYTEFYLKHCNVVKKYVEGVEYNEKKVSALTTSYIPALRARKVIGGKEKELLKSSFLKLTENKNKVMVSLNPDCVSQNIGHYYIYDQTISSEALNEGWGYISLINKETELEKQPFIPFFTDSSWSMKRNKPIQKERFHSEMLVLLDLFRGLPNKTFYIYMYLGTLGHLDVINKIFGGLNNIKIKLNLFGLDKYLKQYNEYVESNNIQENITLSNESSKLLSNNNFLKDLQVWPMLYSEISCAKKSEDLHSLTKDRQYILFSCTSQAEKGFDLVLDLLLSKSFDYRKFTPILRVTEHINSNKELAYKFASLNKTTHEIVVFEGDLSEQSYCDMYSIANIAVVPYKKEFFEFKTSGAVLDCLNYGLPVITTEGTWSGDLVITHSIGEVFIDSNVDSLYKKILKVSKNLEEKSKKIKRNKEDILESFSKNKIFKFISS